VLTFGKSAAYCSHLRNSNLFSTSSALQPDTTKTVPAQRRDAAIFCFTAAVASYACRHSAQRWLPCNPLDDGRRPHIEDELVGRANAGRAVAKARGVRFGRKPKVTDRQQTEGEGG
jgi:hypothetical protein